MDFLEVVIRNKRNFEFDSSKTLEKEQIEQLIASGQLSPSLSEIQNFTYVIIDDQTVKNQLATYSSSACKLQDASVVIAVVVVQTEEDDKNIIDAIISSQQVMMMAISMHLGYDLVVEMEIEKVNELLNVTDQRLSVIALIPVGFPIDDGHQGIKRKMSELSHHNVLGNSYAYKD